MQKRLVLCLIGGLVASASSAPVALPSADENGGVERALPTRSIEVYQLKLLELAFSAVSLMPLDPHIKNRSRAQQKVVEVCLQLGADRTAEHYIEQIDNWRRWQGYADLAGYYAVNGAASESIRCEQKVVRALETAEAIRAGRIVASSPNPLIDSLEGWRYQSVLTRLCEVRLINRSVDRINVNEKTFGELNQSLLLSAMATRGELDFDEAMATLRGLSASHNFEIVHHALMEMADLIGSHYGRADLKEFAENEVSPKLAKSPIFLRIDAYVRFTEIALANEDRELALEFIEALRKMVEPMQSAPVVYVPAAAKMARLQCDAGLEQDAKAMLESLMKLYRSKRDVIVDIERARLLCRLAETYQHAGSTGLALELYREAIAEGQVNPNSRPRAEDLGEICCSMAESRVEPTDGVWAELAAMKSGLGNPW